MEHFSRSAFWSGILFLFLLIAEGAATQIVTPIVTIKDINPIAGSDRIVKVTSTVSRVDAILGENVIFECAVLYIKGDKQVLWKRTLNDASVTLNDGLRSLDSSKYRISQGTSQNSIRLEVMSISYEMAGTYSCEVFYDARSAEIRRSRQIRVFEAPRFLPTETSNEVGGKVGDNVRLQCNATGNPNPRIYWYRSAGSSSVIRNYGRQVDGSIIDLNPLQASDRGTYMCNAINQIGSMQWPVQVTVQFSPIVQFENGATASQKVGCTLELLCKVQANPVVSESAISINKDGSSLVNGQDGVTLIYIRGADSTVYKSLFISPFRASHAGRYSCSARNNLNDGVGSATIDVSVSNQAQPGRSGAIVCSGCQLQVPSLLQLLILSAAAAAAAAAATSDSRRM